MAPLGEGVRRRGTNGIDTRSQVKGKQQPHLFISGDHQPSLYSLLAAARLLSDPLTLLGRLSLARHDQDL